MVVVVSKMVKPMDYVTWPDENLTIDPGVKQTVSRAVKRYCLSRGQSIETFDSLVDALGCNEQVDVC